MFQARASTRRSLPAGLRRFFISRVKGHGSPASPLALAFTAFASLLTAQQATAQTAEELYDKFRVIDDDLQNTLRDSVYRECAGPDVQGFWNAIAAIREEAEFQHQLRGQATFGFQGDDAEGDDTQYKLNAGMQMSRGFYPGEFKFNTEVSVRLKGGAFEEDVTKFFIAYDYYSAPFLEAFAFASRFSDSFMSIDQRYEAGGGVFLGGTLSRVEGLSSEHGVIDASGDHNEMKKKILGDESDNPPWYQCYTRVVGREKAAETSAPAVRKALKVLWDDALVAQEKRHARFRLGVLFGVFGELEQATLMVPTADGTTEGKEEEPMALDGVQRYRWELRPTFEWQIGTHSRASVTPYFKLPFSSFRTTAVDESGVLRDDLFDYRMDLNASLQFTVKESEIGQPGDVKIGLVYNQYLDNAPPFRVVERQGGEPLPVSAPRSHSQIGLNLSVSW